MHQVWADGPGRGRLAVLLNVEDFEGKMTPEQLADGRKRMEFLRMAADVEAMEPEADKEARLLRQTIAHQQMVLGGYEQEFRSSTAGQAYILARDGQPRSWVTAPIVRSKNRLRREVVAFLGWVAEDGFAGACKVFWHLRIVPRFMRQDEFVDLSEAYSTTVEPWDYRK